MSGPQTAPGLLNLPDIYRGCDWLPVIVIWKDPNGNPYDLTAWTPFAQTRAGFSLNPVKTDAVNGVTQISLNAGQTANLTLGIEKWDWIWWNNPPFGFKYPPLLAGQVTIREPITDTFSFPMSVPPNDLFGFAQLITGPTSDPNNPVTGTTLGATTELYEPNPTAVNTVWYVWTSPSTGTEQFWTPSRNFFIDAYMGVDIVSLTYLGTSADNGTVSIVSFPVTANTVFYLRVRPPTTDVAGPFTIGWNFQQPS